MSEDSCCSNVLFLWTNNPFQPKDKTNIVYLLAHGRLIECFPKLALVLFVKLTKKNSLVS